MTAAPVVSATTMSFTVTAVSVSLQCQGKVLDEYSKWWLKQAAAAPAARNNCQVRQPGNAPFP